MGIRDFLVNRFVCNCNTNHGVKKVRVMEGDKIVGRCLKCNKRVFGRIIFKKDDGLVGVSE